MASLAERILGQLDAEDIPLDDDELAARLGVVRQAVNQACRRLATEGRIRRGPSGGGKIVNANAGGEPAKPLPIATTSTITSGAAFELHARRVVSAAWGVALESRIIALGGAVTHSFDLVSPDGALVGDAKWYKDLRPIPSAKLSVIAEYVWLLQHVENAKRRFLVFGQDRAVPDRWLARYQPLLAGVEFWFLDERLTRLA